MKSVLVAILFYHCDSLITIEPAFNTTYVNVCPETALFQYEDLYASPMEYALAMAAANKAIKPAQVQTPVKKVKQRKKKRPR